MINIISFMERRSSFIVLALIFRAFLEWSYVVFVSQVFGYAGFLIEVSVFKYFESWAIYLLLACFFPCVLNRASDYILVFLFAGLLTPVLILYGYADKSRLALYSVIWCASLILLFRNGRPMVLPFISGGQRLGVSILLFLAFIVSAWYVASGGLANFNLDLTKVYDFRRATAELTDKGIMPYLNIWASKVAGPILLAYFLWKRLFVFAAFVLVAHIFWFGVSAHKSVLFYPFLVIFLWVWFRKTKALSFVMLGMSSVIAISMAIYILFEDIFLASMFIRRVFFVVAANTFDYYEFFSENPKIYWSNSLTSFFVSYPYTLNPAILIGEWQGTNAYANNSFVSTGYMHAGLLGVSIYGAFCGFLLRLLDSVVRYGIPVWVGVAAIIVPSQALIMSSDLPTALLTHGFVFSLIILFLLREKNIVKS